MFRWYPVTADPQTKVAIRANFLVAVSVLISRAGEGFLKQWSNLLAKVLMIELFKEVWLGLFILIVLFRQRRDGSTRFCFSFGRRSGLCG